MTGEGGEWGISLSARVVIKYLEKKNHTLSAFGWFFVSFARHTDWTVRMIYEMSAAANIGNTLRYVYRMSVRMNLLN